MRFFLITAVLFFSCIYRTRLNSISLSLSLRHRYIHEFSLARSLTPVNQSIDDRARAETVVRRSALKILNTKTQYSPPPGEGDLPEQPPPESSRKAQLDPGILKAPALLRYKIIR